MVVSSLTIPPPCIGVENKCLCPTKEGSTLKQSSPGFQGQAHYRSKFVYLGPPTSASKSTFWNACVPSREFLEAWKLLNMGVAVAGWR